MSRSTLRIKGTDPDGFKVEVQVKLDCGGHLTRDEMGRLKRTMANQISAVLRGIPYTDFNVMDMTIK